MLWGETGPESKIAGVEGARNISPAIIPMAEV